MQALLPDLDLGPLPPPDPDRPPPRPTRLKGRFALPIQIAGLLAGAWMLLFTVMSHYPRHFTWAGLVGHALRYAFLTWLWSAAVTFLLYFALPTDDRGGALWKTIRTSSAAVWFAPAILLLSELSPAALAAGLDLEVKATRLLYSEWQVTHPQPPLQQLAPALDGLFDGHDLPPRSFGHELMPVLICAGLVQLGVVELSMRRPLPASVLLVAGCATLTIQALSRGAWNEERPSSLPRSLLGALLTIIMAAGMTVTGLSGRVVEGGNGGGGPDGGIAETLRQLMGKDQPLGGLEDAAKDAKGKGAGNAEVLKAAATAQSFATNHPRRQLARRDPAAGRAADSHADRPA